MSAEGGIGALLSGYSGGLKVRNDMDRDEKLEALAQKSVANYVPPPAITTAPAATPVAGSAALAASSDPVATDLAPHQRAFLNAITDGEAGGKYNIRYTPNGGATFDDLTKHPGIMEPTADGKKSSAAGRYQFTKSTWDAMGGGDFSPENQDRRAWQLAQSDYAARTGRNLDADLQQGGLTSGILKTLSPTWTSFNSNQDRHIAAYADSLSRYSKPSKSVQSASGDSAPSGGVLDLFAKMNPTPRSVQ